MTKIDRDLRIVIKFKGGMSTNRLAREFKLKPLMIERVIRNWFNDIAGIAIRAGDGVLWRGRDVARFPSSEVRVKQR